MRSEKNGKWEVGRGLLFVIAVWSCVGPIVILCIFLGDFRKRHELSISDRWS